MIINDRNISKNLQIKKQTGKKEKDNIPEDTVALGQNGGKLSFHSLDEEMFHRVSENPDRASVTEESPASESLIFSKALKVDPEELKKDMKQWTVLCYFNGNCDLQSDMEADLKKLEEAGSDGNINFVAQISHGDKGGDAERILLKKPSWMGLKKNSEVMAELPKTNMSHPQTLKDFLSWGIKTFPAKHYMVVLSGHGMGFVGSLPDDNADDIMLTSELKSAMDVAKEETGKKIDILGFDSCLMANAETAYAVKDSVDFMVASEEVLISDNWDYGDLASRMKEGAEKGDLSVADTLGAMINSQQNYALLTASIIDCRRMPEFGTKLKDFSDKLLKTGDSAQEIKRSFRRAQHYCQPGILSQSSNGGNINTKPMDQMRDVASVALEIARSDGLKDMDLKKSALDLAKFVVDKAVIFEMHRKDVGLSDSGGMSIYAPASEAEKFSDYYKNLSISKDTGWGEVVEKFGI